jgi:hypothetical protein
MKRSTLIRKTALRQRRKEPAAAVEREVTPRAVQPRPADAPRGTYAGGTSGRAVVKPEPYRDSALLEMARGRPCLLLVPGICNHRQDTTVACHSNLSVHGKAGARKADDQFSCWGCAACHEWLDRSGALAAIKEVAFMGAHSRQVLAWRMVAADAGEPERFRRAAQRALERLNATPIGETP